MISKICLNNEYIQILHFSEDETTALFHRRFVRPRFIKYPWYKLSTTEKCSVFKEINKEKSSERKRDRISACWTELAEPSKFIRIVEGITQVSVFRQGCTIYLEITEFNAYYGPNKSKLKCRCLVRMLKNWIIWLGGQVKSLRWGWDNGCLNIYCRIAHPSTGIFHQNSMYVSSSLRVL